MLAELLANDIEDVVKGTVWWTVQVLEFTKAGKSEEQPKLVRESIRKIITFPTITPIKAMKDSRAN